MLLNSKGDDCCPAVVISLTDGFQKSITTIRLLLGTKIRKCFCTPTLNGILWRMPMGALVAKVRYISSCYFGHFVDSFKRSTSYWIWTQWHQQQLENYSHQGSPWNRTWPYCAQRGCIPAPPHEHTKLPPHPWCCLSLDADQPRIYHLGQGRPFEVQRYPIPTCACQW